MLRPTRFVWPDSTLVAVVDGDTVDVFLTLDVGFGRRLSGPQRLRLNRIDAYKVTSPAGQDAARLVAAELSHAPFTVETLKPYKYGGNLAAAEYMAEVVLPDGRNLSDVLLTAGLALSYDGRGPRPTES